MSKPKMWRLMVICSMLLLAAPGILKAAPPGQAEQVYTVTLADSMWNIAEKYLGNGAAYPAIVEATNNKHAEDASFPEIKDPGMIQPGWKLLIPSAAEAEAAMAAYKPAVPSSRPLVWAVKTEGRGFDPHQFDYDYDQNIQRPVLEPLMDYKVMPDGSVDTVGILAESWEGSADAKVWTFHLRPGITFHDGTPWNAEAAKWNFERLFALNLVPATRIPTNVWPAEGGIEAVDDLTLRITLQNPFGPFIDTLVKKYMISPTAAQAHEQDGDYCKAWCNENPVGTGPYLLEEWVKGQQVSFKMNPDYWGGWEGNHAQRIIQRYVPEAATQKLLLEKGDVDLAQKIELDDLEAVAQVPGVVVEEHRVPRLIHMFMRMQGPFEDVRVRQAVAHAFDYDAFIQGVWNGRAVKPLSPLPAAVWAFDPQPEVTHDLDLAKQLMAEAGYPDGGFSVKIFTISSYGWFQPREAQILQENLKELGIESSIEDYPDAGAFISTLQSPDLGPALYAWTFTNAYNDPEDNLRRSYRSDGTLNYIMYNNPRVDELIDQGAVTLDRDERFKIYSEAQKLIWEDYPALFTAEEKWFVTRRDTLHGYDFYPFIINMSPNWYDMWVSD
jgi:peptide/nickel transport system substrate-binding protein